MKNKINKPRLLIVGCGDIGMRLLPLLRDAFRIFAVIRSADHGAALRAAGATPIIADLDHLDSLARCARLAPYIVHLAPPPSHKPNNLHDQRSRNLTAILPRHATLVYISTSGVYGDCGGVWVNENRPVQPQSARAKRRVDAEQILRVWARCSHSRLSILRVPGIVAENRWPLQRLENKIPALLPDEDVFTNHIHADDLARIIKLALFRARHCRVYHAVDDTQMKMGDYFDAVANAFALPRPPRLSRTELQQVVTPLQWSFLSESRRLSNQRMKSELGVRLRYPTIAAALPSSAHVDRFAENHLPAKAAWPDFIVDTPNVRYPTRLNCITQLLDKWVEGADHADYIDRIAIYSEQGKWTYRQLQQAVNQIAHVLQTKLALQPGNRVLLRGANTFMMAACFLAVIKAGCIAVPSMPLLREQELSLMIEKAQIDAILCCASLKQEIPESSLSSLDKVVYFHDESPHGLEQLMTNQPTTFTAIDTAADDVCLISFTTGTTGTPKATMHFHRDLLAICDCFPRFILQTQVDDIFIGSTPLAFTFGLGGMLLFPLRVGAATVLLEKISPAILLQAIQDFRASVSFSVPTLYRQMTSLVANYDVSSLRASVSAGEALPIETRENWQKLTGLAMIDGLGTTELLHIVISAAGSDIHPGATGKVIPPYQACVLDDAGQPVPAGVIGRLAVKGPTGCRYLDDAEQQKKYVYQGWNMTGDVVEMDSDGYFYYRGRSDDMIISAGYNIAALEVEQVLIRHPSVVECAVVGHPDAERGQIVQAHVVLHPGYEPDATTRKTLQDFVKQRIAPYKYPRAVEFCTALPRTESGKLQRYKLRGLSL